MKRPWGVCTAVAVLAAVLGAAWWYVNRLPDVELRVQSELEHALARLGIAAEPPSAELRVSGFIEADEFSVSTELGGRIAALLAEEGDRVQAGQELVRLDDSLLRSQIQAAEAEVAVAEASLAQLQAGVRRETLDHALAILQQAEQSQQAALVAWTDAQRMAENPQELGLAIVAARTELAVAALQERQALAAANSAQAGHDFADEVLATLEDFEPFAVGEEPYRAKIRRPSDALITARQNQAVAAYQAWEAWAGYAQAQAAQIGAERYLAELLRQQADPTALQAAARAAEAQCQIASAAVAVAQAGVDGLRMGATDEQIAVARAQVALAKAARDTLLAQAAKLSLKAPIAGLVLEQPAQMGELAKPGAALLTLADLDNLSLTVYIPEDRLSRVQVGEQVSVTVDAYPDRAFWGIVASVASEAEFTPKNIQTPEERVSMVFGVRVSLPNSDYALRPGMPADAVVWPAPRGQ